MSTPFICRQCIARLSQSSVKRLKPKRSRLHTQAAPTPASSPTWHPVTEGSNPQSSAGQSSEARQSLGGQGIQAPLPSVGENLNRSGPGGESIEDIEGQWDGNLKKFVPRRRKTWEEIAETPRATTARELKARIMEARGDYKIVHQDLMHIYGLSLSEARHTVSQLERLLWGRPWMDMAVRLDAFHIWKRDFSRQLQAISQNITDSELNADEPKVGPWTSFAEEDHATMKAAWQRLDQSKREQLWPQMVLSAFTSNPGVLPAFIRATFHPSWCPSYILEDMVYLLFRTLDSLQSLGQEERQVAELIPFILDHCPPRYMAFDQYVLYKVITVLNLDELVEFYETLKRTEHSVHTNTMQQIASRFAKSSAHKLQAADVICSLTDIPGFDINLPAPASVCTSLLTLDVSDSIPEGQAEPDELFKLLLEHGFRPNLLALTALMRNFCVRGHLDTAWKIFDLLLQHNFEPDPHVFSILLNGSKHAFDIPSVRKIIEMVFSRDAWTGIIVDDFIDLMFRENEARSERRRQKKSSSAWRPMLQLYAKFYDLRPLQKFFTSPLENVIAGRGVVPRNATLITDLADALRPLPDHLLFKPTSHTLLLLLAAHVRSINNPSKVIRQYRHFNQLLKSRDPVATQLIADKGTKIYDIFLRAMMQFRESLKAPMSIIYNMMTSAEREKKHTGRNIYHPFPSVHTWTILLNGFKNHKHIRGAVNVLNMMIQLGNVQPNLVTWNALINAFAQVGDVQGAVRTMALLEQGGLSSDDRTVEAFNAFSRARREKAIQLLEEARKEPVNNFGDPGTVLGDGGGGGNGMVRSGIHFPRRSWESSDFSTDRHPRDPRSGPLDGGGGAPPLEPSLAQRLARARRDWDRDAADIVQRSDLPFP